MKIPSRELYFRLERDSDQAQIAALLETVFAPQNAKRRYDSLRSELSLLVFYQDELCGVIFYHNAIIKQADGTVIPILSFEHLAVTPKMQKRGIGQALVKCTRVLAAEDGHKYVVIHGELEYFGRFGFKEARNFKLRNSQSIELSELLLLKLTDENLDISGEVIF